MVTNAPRKIAWDNPDETSRQGGRPLRDWVDSKGASRVQMVVENAWRRRHLVLTVEHSAVALALVCCGAILILLLGTDILDWPWLLLLAAAGAAITSVRVRKRVVNRYKVAQVVDRRLALTDSLSTAWYLSTAHSAADNVFAPEQISRAEELAGKIKLAAVFPFVWRRSWAWAGVLAAVAFGLFALRYFTTDQLSFRKELIPVAFLSRADVMERLEHLIGRPGERDQTASAGAKPGGQQHADGLRRDDGSQLDAQAQGQGSSQENARAGLQEPGTAPREGGQSTAGEQKQGSSRENGGVQTSKEAATQEITDSGKGNNRSRAESARSGDEQHPAGLMDRMKDAVSDLMAKMRPKEGAAQRAGEKEASGQQSKAEGDAKSNSESAMKQQNKSKSESQGDSREQSGQGQAQADASEKPPGAQSRASDESADRKGSSAQSGVGRQDGEKTIKHAEQLRAM